MFLGAFYFILFSLKNWNFTELHSLLAFHNWHSLYIINWIWRPENGATCLNFSGFYLFFHSLINRHSLPCSERFFSGTPVFPLLKNQHFQIPNNLIWNARTCSNEFIWTPMCLVGKHAIYNFLFFTELPCKYACLKPGPPWIKWTPPGNPLFQTISNGTFFVPLLNQF